MRGSGLCDIPGCDRLAGLYPCGARCLQHSPAVVAGRIRPTPDPLRSLKGLRDAAGYVDSYLPNTSALNDERAIRTGKRRSSPLTLKAARMAEEMRKDNQ